MSVKRYVVVLWIALLMEHFSCTTDEQGKVWAERDTYVEAYTNTNSHVSPVFHSNSVFPAPKYGIPFPSYNSPGPDFHPNYDLPSGPAGLTSPSGPSAYGFPYSPMYVAPYAAPHNGFKGLPAGLDFATLCKIILKVLIFKMIVKFIAVICVLLFLPKLDSGGSSTADMKLLSSRDDMGDTTNERLNILTRLILESVDNSASVEINEKCKDDVHCRLKRVAEYVDDKSTVLRLLTLFLLEYALTTDQSPGKG